MPPVSVWGGVSLFCSLQWLVNAGDTNGAAGPGLPVVLRVVPSYGCQKPELQQGPKRCGQRAELCRGGG